MQITEVTLQFHLVSLDFTNSNKSNKDTEGATVRNVYTYVHMWNSNRISVVWINKHQQNPLPLTTCLSGLMSFWA